MKNWQFVWLVGLVLSLDTAIMTLKVNPSQLHEIATLATATASTLAIIAGLLIFIFYRDRTDEN